MISHDKSYVKGNDNTFPRAFVPQDFFPKNDTFRLVIFLSDANAECIDQLRPFHVSKERVVLVVTSTPQADGIRRLPTLILLTCGVRIQQQVRKIIVLTGYVRETIQVNEVTAVSACCVVVDK